MHVSDLIIGPLLPAEVFVGLTVYNICKGGNTELAARWNVQE